MFFKDEGLMQPVHVAIHYFCLFTWSFFGLVWSVGVYYLHLACISLLYVAGQTCVTHFCVTSHWLSIADLTDVIEIDPLRVSPSIPSSSHSYKCAV